ncbi:MAG: hypothetical protein KJ927_09580, partial [Candidatus Eisenbacteria bacterium]|nr:hypothetical protein [Candidatus Eisenbacteria bacterium]
MRIPTHLRPFYAALILILLFLFPPSHATADGDARGKIAVIEDAAMLHAFSTETGHWSSLNYSGSVMTHLLSDYLGLFITDENVYAYNPISNNWVPHHYLGNLLGWDLKSATAVCWTANNCFAVATIWAQWNVEPMSYRERVIGAGSAGNFALVWTNVRALAYSSGTGAWVTIQLPERAVGGLASDGLGLVWTDASVYAFDATPPGAWIPLGLEGVQGISAAGSGEIGLIWGDNEALAYSGVLNDWFNINSDQSFLGGVAGGEVGLIWTETKAFGFNAWTGQWVSLSLQPETSGVEEPSQSSSDQFRISPNPCAGPTMSFQLPGDSSWRLDIVDVTG